MILDIVLRYLYYKQIEKLKVFGKYLAKNDVETIGNLIIDISIISDSFEATNEIKKEIVDRIKDDIKSFNKIYLEKNKDYKCIIDLKLIILLQSIYGQIKEINVDYGFKDLDWSSFQYLYLTKILISKLNGVSLLFYLDNYYLNLKNISRLDLSLNNFLTTDEILNKLNDELKQDKELVREDWYIKNAKTIQEIDQKINEIKRELINCSQHKYVEINYELFKLRKRIFSEKSIKKDEHFTWIDKSLNSYALNEFLSESEYNEHIKPILINFPNKKIEEVELNQQLEKEINLSSILQKKKERYDCLFETIVESDNILLLYNCLRDFISFAILELDNDELAIKYFRKYHEKMMKNNNINELWIYTFLEFLNTKKSSNENLNQLDKFVLISNLDSPINQTFKLEKSIEERFSLGLSYMQEFTEEVESKFKKTALYLSKVIESSTLSDISQLYLNLRKDFIVRFKKDFKPELINLILDFKFKLIKTYSNTHKSYIKFIKHIAGILNAKDLFNESNEELFELIEIRKNLLARLKNKFPSDPNYLISMKLNMKEGSDIRNVLYQISWNYLKLGDLKKSLNYILKSIDEYSNKFKEWEDRGSKGNKSFGWKIEKNKLIPIENIQEKLYLLGGEIKPLLIKWASLYLQLARIYSLKKEYKKSNAAFDESLIYIFEKVLHIDYNLIQLEKGINMHKFNKSESIKIIKEALKKLDKKSIPNEEIKIWNSNREYINSILEKGKEILIK